MDYVKSKASFTYLPLLNQLLEEWTLPPLGLIDSSSKATRAYCKKSYAENAPIERCRRYVRLQIVLFAQCLWEGKDLYPHLNMLEGINGDDAQLNVLNPAKYHIFRTRFAPTHILGKFLFPRHLLEALPTNLPYEPLGDNGQWLEDPTKKLIVRARQQHRKIPAPHLRAAAQQMLDALTDVRSAKYQCKGFGGSVDVWIQAAHAYHEQRLLASLETDTIYSMSHIDKANHKHAGYRRLTDLRGKLDLYDPQGEIRLSVPRPRVTDYLHRGTHLYMARDRRAMREENARELKVKAFNKILSKTCSICPVSGGLYQPMGVEGFVVRAASQTEDRRKMKC